ncbi:MAG: YggS family pyridoxal phosphate-dependent enzyme [Candidatus Competibacteraceae bacterium]|nr:YggS family pyridoxal phosphate-dependent enzyme [Candidatus Competibacteraceae bacterium]
MSDPVSTLASRIGSVRARICAAEARFGRAPGSVTLLAVSKTRPAPELRQAAAQGLTRFGENYLQEALDKRQALADLELEWHFIGPIQSNKTRPIAENFSWVHSVDRLKIARRLSQQRPAELPPLSICLQVNISGEASKSGLAPPEVSEVAQEVARLPNLRLRGLMAIPAPAWDFEAQRRPLARLRQLQERLIEQGLELDTLSMGMTDDLEAAVAEGATLVRIGTALFGPRPVAKSPPGL